jgi:hypothetical protein
VKQPLSEQHKLGIRLNISVRIIFGKKEVRRVLCPYLRIGEYQKLVFFQHDSRNMACGSGAATG